MKRIKLLLCALLQPLLLYAQTSFPLVSPLETLNAEIQVNGKKVQVGLFTEGEKVIETKTLQFEFEETVLAGNWQITNQTRNKVDQTWQLVYGERNLITNHYNELQLTLRSDVNQKEMTLEVRLYDEGLAFRYAFNELDFWNQTLLNEKTQFLFKEGRKTWVTGMAQGTYSKKSLSALSGAADRPQVIQIDDNRFVAIGETALVDYSRMKQEKSETGFGVQSLLSGKVNLDLAKYQSPSHYIMVATHPGQLVQNNDFVLNLNEPNQIANLYYQVPRKKKDVVSIKTMELQPSVVLDVEANSGCVLHLPIL